MIEIRKINVKRTDSNTKVVENLSLRIENGKIEVIEGTDSMTLDKLSEMIRDEQYEVRIDDILLNHQSFKKLLSSKNMGKKLLNIVQKEFSLMQQNQFYSLNCSKKQKRSFLEYINHEVDNKKSNVMEDIHSSIHTKVFGNDETYLDTDSRVNIDSEQSKFDINHFVISAKLLNNNGFSLIQFLGLIIGLGLIILTSMKVYGAAVGASSVNYNNQNSGLTATNVQGAIDQTYSYAEEVASGEYAPVIHCLSMEKNILKCYADDFQSSQGSKVAGGLANLTPGFIYRTQWGVIYKDSNGEYKQETCSGEPNFNLENKGAYLRIDFSKYGKESLGGDGSCSKNGELYLIIPAGLFGSKKYPNIRNARISMRNLGQYIGS